MNERKKIMAGIAEAIKDVSKKKEVYGIKSLSRYNPNKVAKILYLHSQGFSVGSIHREYGFSKHTIVSILVDYADYVGKWKELGAKIAARNFLKLYSLQEEIIDRVSRSLDDEDSKVSIKDLLPVSIALEKAERSSNHFRGQPSEITEERHVVTRDQLTATEDMIRKRMLEYKKSDSIDVIPK
jgi:hypothetical protein